MIYTTIIPAHNEEAFIGRTLESLAAQTLLPNLVIVVDDNSTDATSTIAAAYAQKFQDFKIVKNASGHEHLPGSKVIRAFNKGLEHAGEYDVIVKLDADLVLPPDYFENIMQAFASDAKTGMAGGFATIERNGQWIVENLTDKDHIRGAFKAYRKECFEQIGKLKPAMGWDTVDELLARYHGWNVVTIPGLHVKHLKPTGANYGKAARYKQGEAFYALGYGFWITAIASAKLAMRKRQPSLAVDYLAGFFKARQNAVPMLVNQDQARWIRQYRWKKIRAKFS